MDGCNPCMDIPKPRETPFRSELLKHVKPVGASYEMPAFNLASFRGDVGELVVRQLAHRITDASTVAIAKATHCISWGIDGRNQYRFEGALVSRDQLERIDASLVRNEELQAENDKLVGDKRALTEVRSRINDARSRLARELRAVRSELCESRRKQGSGVSCAEASRLHRENEDLRYVLQKTNRDLETQSQSNGHLSTANDRLRKQLAEANERLDALDFAVTGKRSDF